MMLISFFAIGSLYYAHDLARSVAILLRDECFYIGLDMRLPMWYGRKSQLDVDWGLCMPLSAFFIMPLN